MAEEFSEIQMWCSRTGESVLVKFRRSGPHDKFRAYSTERNNPQIPLPRPAPPQPEKRGWFVSKKPAAPPPQPPRPTFRPLDEYDWIHLCPCCGSNDGTVFDNHPSAEYAHFVCSGGKYIAQDGRPAWRCVCGANNYTDDGTFLVSGGVPETGRQQGLETTFVDFQPVPAEPARLGGPPQPKLDAPARPSLPPPRNR